MATPTMDDYVRWNDADAIMREIYDTLSNNYEVETILRRVIDYFEEFT